MEKDCLFDQKIDVSEFCFNADVAAVFADMLARSVPGYQTMLEMMTLFAERYGQHNSRFYDLGCSLGAVSLALSKTAAKRNIDIIAVDYSADMIAKCRRNLNHLKNSNILCQDITTLDISRASVVVLNLTLQFIQPAKRHALLKTIYQGLKAGGILLLSEKTHRKNASENNILQTLHLDFKRANGYSELAISQKRAALENVLQTDEAWHHIKRLKQIGFAHALCWFQCFNFASFIAFKSSS